MIAHTLHENHSDCVSTREENNILQNPSLNKVSSHRPGSIPEQFVSDERRRPEEQHGHEFPPAEHSGLD